MPAAGGNADITARLVGQEMSKLLGQPVVVENRVGAGGRIGTQALVRAPADGYTIGYAHVGTLVLHRYLFKQQLYDLDRDLAPIGLVTETPNVIVVNAASPYRDLKSFIDASRAQPDKLTMTSADPGTTSEVGVKLFVAQTGAAVRQIPYKATAAQLSDLQGGHVDSMMENLPPLIGNLKDGRLRALAVTTRQRAASNPDVPTVAEQGYPDYEQSAWSALVAPAGTPPAVLARLNDALNQAPAHRRRGPRIAQPLAGTAGRRAAGRKPRSRRNCPDGKTSSGAPAPRSTDHAPPDDDRSPRMTTVTREDFSCRDQRIRLSPRHGAGAAHRRRPRPRRRADGRRAWRRVGRPGRDPGILASIARS